MSRGREREPTQRAAGAATDALAELEACLAEPLDAAVCARIAELAREVPGRQRQVISRLAEDRTGAGVDALLRFPPTTPGVVEGVYHALRLGITRELDGRPCPEQLALEFRRSRARAFPELLAHAEAAFPEHLERLELDGAPAYRLSIWTGPRRQHLRDLLRAHGGDLLYLHGRLARLRGARLWLNGWVFASDGPWTAAHQVHLVRAWVDHASSPAAS
ncbi:MAG: hypothetical protein R3A79_14355 [Nannocystaceae bacterium]